MSKCQKCGCEAGNAKFCPECGAPINVQNQTNQPNAPYVASPPPNNTYNNNIPQKQGQSTLGIVALVLCATGCLGIVGLVLAIIDLAKNDNAKKHTCSKIAIGIFAVYTAICIVFGMASDTSTSDSSKTSSSQTKEINDSENVEEKATEQEKVTAEGGEKVKESKKSNQEDNIIDIEFSDCHIKYTSCEVVNNMAGDQCLAVYYEFTNNSEDNQAFVWTASEKAFQGGVELESSLFHVNDDSKTSDVEIQPGVTVTVCSGFVLRDNSEVTIEVEPLISFTDDDKDTMKIQFQ